MLFFAQCNMYFLLLRLMIFNDRERLDDKRIADKVRLRRNDEWANSLVFFAHFHNLLFHICCLVAHAFCECAHVSSFVREDICLILVRLNLFCEERVLSVLFFDTCRDILHHILVVADILLDDASVRVKIEHAFGKHIEKFRIMRNDDNRFRIVDQKVSEMSDSCLVEIVGRFIEEKEIGVLDECRCEKQARLLTARK